MKRKIKRFLGTARITAMSAEMPSAVGLILWIFINFSFADTMGRRISTSLVPVINYFFLDYYSDCATVMILILTAAFFAVRHTRLCTANSVSVKSQTLHMAFAGIFISAFYAVIDVIFVKTVISELCREKYTYTFFENIAKSYDTKPIPLQSEKLDTLIFATGVYYLLIFAAAYFFARCVQSRSKIFRNYIIWTISASVFLFIMIEMPWIREWDSLVLSLAVFLVLLIWTITTPPVTLFIMPLMFDTDKKLTVFFISAAIYLTAMLLLTANTKVDLTNKYSRRKRQ